MSTPGSRRMLYERMLKVLLLLLLLFCSTNQVLYCSVHTNFSLLLLP